MNPKMKKTLTLNNWLKVGEFEVVFLTEQSQAGKQHGN